MIRLVFACINIGFFPLKRKKVNVVPVYQKGDKKCLKSNGPISLLPIREEKLERLIFNEMFKFRIENNLISSNQSGFKPGDSYIN